MPTVLHLLGHNASASRAVPVIAGQLAAGDAVTVAVVGAATPPLPPGTEVRRVPADVSWDDLVDLIFTADQTFSW
jgi:hypothetical protein